MIVAASQSIVITRDQTDAEGLPAANTHTAVLWKNGAATAESVTPGNPETGVYVFAWTIPADAVADDVFSLRVVDGDGFAATVWEAIVGRPAVLNTATQTQIDNIEQTVEGLSSGSGTGARTVTITVNDGATVLQNATVRMTEGVSTFTALTNVSGAAVFNLDDATYAVSITKPGYSYAGTSLIVNGTETATYSMTAISVTPPDDPALSAVTIHLRDQYGDDLGGQPVEITFVKWDATATETPPVLSIPPVQTTDSGGLVQVNLYRLAVYKIIYGEARDARRWDGTIPDAGSYEVEL